MNLWVKRTGQLVSLAVALFFLSCQDDVSVLGYRNPNSKFNVKYIEIELESNVFLSDSVRTVVLANETSRLLVGEYNDPDFGYVKAIGYTQVAPTRFGKSEAVATYVYDSTALLLHFDHYSYGGTDISKQSFAIHEIDSTLELRTSTVNKFLSNLKVPYKPEMIGTNSFDVNGKTFKDMFEGTIASKDTTIHISFKDSGYGSKLWNHAVSISDADTTFVKNFLADVKGLAILPIGSTNEKIVGIDPNSALSNIVVYYHKSGDTVQRKLNFRFYGAKYTNIQSTFTGDLSGLMNKYDSVTPGSKRYIQQGTRVITKVDMANFYKFADTVERMIINSAELAITEVDDDDDYYHIPTIGFVAMSDYQTNRFQKGSYYLDTTTVNGVITSITRELADSLKLIVSSYQGYINDVNGVFSAMNDTRSEPVILQWTGTGYSAYVTLLTQQLSLRQPSDRYRYFSLFPSIPSTPQKEKSVNRTVFDKGNLVLRIYYTTPKEPQQ